jgi:F420-dependent oxidoreductase-like protein
MSFTRCGAVVVGDHDLPVLPYAEAKRQQENQSGRQQRELRVDPVDFGNHRPHEFSCASERRTTVGSMRFAFKTSPQDTTWADMLAVWQAADDIDIYESGWTFDHFYPIFGNSSGPCLEGWTTLTALAQATTRLRVGTLVTGIHYRHPAVLANMAAALDIISNGRLELGIGAGWNEEESGAYGIELGTIKERFDRFEEACEVLTSLLSQETTDFDGKFYQLKGARNEPKGPQRPHPPICIGGSGEKRTLRITARYAQHWNFAGGPPDVFAHKRDVLASHCADIGRDPKEITLSAHLRLESDRNYGKVVEDAAALAAEGLDLGIVYIATTRPCWNRWPRRSANLVLLAR